MPWIFFGAVPDNAMRCYERRHEKESIEQGGTGSSSAGLIANSAGLGNGIAMDTVTTAANWVYGVAVAPASLIALLAFRLLWLRRG